MFSWKIGQYAFIKNDWGVSKANIDELVIAWKLFYAQNLPALAEVWILTLKRPGAGANWEAV